jgi:hypothetical protein
MVGSIAKRKVAHGWEPSEGLTGGLGSLTISYKRRGEIGATPASGDAFPDASTIQWRRAPVNSPRRHFPLGSLRGRSWRAATRPGTIETIRRGLLLFLIVDWRLPSHKGGLSTRSQGFTSRTRGPDTAGPDSRLGAGKTEDPKAYGLPWSGEVEKIGETTIQRFRSERTDWSYRSHPASGMRVG